MEHNNNTKPTKESLLEQYLAEDKSDAFGFVGTYGGTLALVTVLRVRLTPEVLGMVTGSVEESSDGIFWQVRLSKSAAVVDRLKEIGANVFPLGFSKDDIETAFTAQGVDEKRKSRGKLFEDMTARALGWAQEESQRADHKVTGDLVTPWGDRVQVKYYRAAFTVSKQTSQSDGEGLTPLRGNAAARSQARARATQGGANALDAQGGINVSVSNSTAANGE